MLGRIGMGELLIGALIIVLLFGARRIPALARALGQSMAEFKKGRRDGAAAPPAIGQESKIAGMGADARSQP